MKKLLLAVMPLVAGARSNPCGKAQVFVGHVGADSSTADFAVSATADYSIGEYMAPGSSLCTDVGNDGEGKCGEGKCDERESMTTPFSFLTPTVAAARSRLIGRANSYRPNFSAGGSLGRLKFGFC